MRLSSRLFLKSMWLMYMCVGNIDTTQTLLYPLCELPNGPLSKNMWLFYLQECNKSAIMLWHKNTETITRLTSARFYPKRVQCSPDGSIISFLDDGIVWLRRISRRYTRPLETAFPIGTIVDYVWYNTHHIIVSSRKGNNAFLYCINLDGTVCGELCFSQASISYLSSLDDTLLCIIHKDGAQKKRKYALMQVRVCADKHPIQLSIMCQLLSTEQPLLFCKHITKTTGYYMAMTQQNPTTLGGSLYYINYENRLPKIHFIAHIPLESITVLDEHKKVKLRYTDGLQSIIPTVCPSIKQLGIPLINRQCVSGIETVNSRLMLFDYEHQVLRKCAQQTGVAFLSPQLMSSFLLCGGVVKQNENYPEPASDVYECVMYYDDDSYKLKPIHVTYKA